MVTLNTVKNEWIYIWTSLELFLTESLHFFHNIPLGVHDNSASHTLHIPSTRNHNLSSPKSSQLVPNAPSSMKHFSIFWNWNRTFLLSTFMLSRSVVNTLWPTGQISLTVSHWNPAMLIHLLVVCIHFHAAVAWSWVVLIETAWLTKSNTFTMWPFILKVFWPRISIMLIRKIPMFYN